MIKWTTPTMTCKLPEGTECDYIILTLKQGNVAVEKTVQSQDIVDGEFAVTFTQTEMGQFTPSQYSSFPVYAEVQLNIINGNKRLATNVIKVQIVKNLHDEAIS